ncbi:MAG: 3'-5' exonuclease [Bacteroidota bacterium]
MFLFFHTNAVGKPKSWKAPYTDTFAWPRMIQLAWQLYDKTGLLKEKASHIIYPEGFDIPYDSERFHQISTERARGEGTDLEEVLREFKSKIDVAEYVVAHNWNLDANVVAAEFERKDISQTLFSSEFFSLMAESTYYCKLPGKYGKYKWPTLSELHAKVFGARFEDPYNSEVAVQALANCFFALVRKEEIDLFE